jgi:hypothetical protein
MEAAGGSPGGLVREMYHYLGLADRSGRRYRDPKSGNPILKNPRNAQGQEVACIEASQVSMLATAHALLGENWYDKFNPNVVARIAMMEEQKPILEAGTSPIAASDFISINAFTAITTGLFEVGMLQGWNRPGFIDDQLAPDDPTRVFGGKKKIGIGGVGDKAEKRLPGMPTKRANVTEKWINTPETQESALSYELLQEAVYLDLTGDVQREANDIGFWLRYRKQMRVIDMFIGVSGTTQYNYKGTTYNPYISSGYYDNDFSNELLHWSDYQETLVKFRDMKDPETNTRVSIQPNKVLVQLEKRVTADSIFGNIAGQVQYRDSGSAPNIRSFDSPYRGVVQVMDNPYVYERLTASDGLALSASDAGKYWWAWDDRNGGPCLYATNWPLRLQTAIPNSMDMLDRGIVAFVKVDERGEPYWMEPRKVVRNKA